MSAKKVFSSELVAKVANGLNAMGINAECVDKDLLDCAIDEIRKIKTSAKESLAEQAKAQREAQKAENIENGKALLKGANVGDIVTVICGSGKFAKEYKFPIVKIGEATVTVEYTEGNTPNGTTGVRYINFSKVVGVEKAE